MRRFSYFLLSFIILTCFWIFIFDYNGLLFPKAYEDKILVSPQFKVKTTNKGKISFILDDSFKVTCLSAEPICEIDDKIQKINYVNLLTIRRSSIFFNYREKDVMFSDSYINDMVFIDINGNLKKFVFSQEKVDNAIFKRFLIRDFILCVAFFLCCMKLVLHFYIGSARFDKYLFFAFITIFVCIILFNLFSY